MNSENRFLHSKMARRIFVFFAAAALIPICAFAAFSLHSLTVQLQQQSGRQLDQFSREEGTLIYDRLGFLEGDMKLIGLAMRASPGVDPESTFGGLYGHSPEFAMRFTGVALVTPDGNQRALFGKIPSRLGFSAEEQKHLDSGRNILSSVPCNERRECLLLSRELDSNHPANGTLIAQINPAYLWKAEEVPSKAEICVLDPAGKILFGTTNSPSTFPDQLSRSISGEFEWKQGQREFLAGYWSLSLANTFFAPHWTVVVSEAKPDILAPLARFKLTFYLVCLLAFWIALLFSLVETRKNLIPLNELKAGTDRISDGNFQARVKLITGDEFEGLAASFNLMADRIESQLNSLKSNTKLVADLRELQWGTLTAFARAIDAKSQWTAGHSERVTGWALKIAKSMGLSTKELDTIRRGGLLHDIGNLGIAVSVLDKPGKWTAEELKVLERQVNMGSKILATIPGLSDCLPIVMQHHEWVEGGGCPSGVKGEEISLHARILAVADCFDALTSARPDRSGLPVEQVIQILREGAGKQFDPAVVEAIQRVLQEESKKEVKQEEVKGDTGAEVLVP